MARFDVLVSSGGRRVALVRILQRALRELGLEGRVVVADQTPLSAAFHAADDGFVVPPCTSTEFIPRMLEICQESAIRLVVPTIDTELGVYAESREAFAEVGTTVGISSPEVIAIGSDKSETHRWLSQCGFPVVGQATASAVLADPSAWSFPLIAKPCFGSASLGVTIVADLQKLAEATSDGDFVVQTIAQGDEHTIDILADRSGGCVSAVPRRRLEVRAGEVSKAMTVRSRPLIDLAHRICEQLPGAYGPLNVQIFAAGDGDLRVIEVNPRFGGGFPLSWEAGARFPVWMIEEILGRRPTDQAKEWRDGVVMLRYDEGVFVDAGEVGL